MIMIDNKLAGTALAKSTRLLRRNGSVTNTLSVAIPVTTTSGDLASPLFVLPAKADRTAVLADASAFGFVDLCDDVNLLAHAGDRSTGRVPAFAMNMGDEHAVQR